MSTQTESPFLVQVAKDHLSATIALRKDAAAEGMTPSDVAVALEAAKIAVDDAVVQRIHEFLIRLGEPGQDQVTDYLIAQGRPPSEGTDGSFAWEEALQKQAAEWSEDAAVDYYSVSAITTVEEGARIGLITPPRPALQGVDVHGNRLRPKCQPREAILKQGVRLAEDQCTVVATRSGKVVYRNGVLSVEPVVEIAGDVDFETGSLDLSADTVVRGTVRDLFTVVTRQNLTVGGAIEAAEVRADGDVVVRGGILNRGKGKVEVGGEIVAKFCDEAHLRAQGNIRIVKEIINSCIHTENQLIVQRGAVIGGDIFARRGLEAAVLGSEAGVPTFIWVGLHPEELRKIDESAKENEKRRGAVDKIRQSVGPLMAQLKRLTNEQRERATELMYQADMLEAEIKKSEQEVQALLQQVEEPAPYVLVTSRIHQRVTVTINDRTVTFNEELTGPATIERRKVKNYSAIVAVNQLTGSLRELPARKIESRAPKSAPAGRRSPGGR